MHNPLSIVLRPVGLLYRTITQLRNALFERTLLSTWNSPVPVVSIGNLTAGGTGKTPLVDWITKYYLSIGCKPAIISRGYRRESKGVKLVSDGNRVLLSSREAGDETAMLAWNNPDAVVIVAEKRKDAVTWMIKHFTGRVPSVIILDDAFQHRQLGRALDIAIVNAAEPFFKAKMLPEGRLREPLKNIERADLILLNKITDNEQAETLKKELEKTGRPVIKARQKTGDLICLSGECISSEEAPRPESLNALAFAGIASPESFLESLKLKGVTVSAHRFFKDHEPYTAKKLQSIRREADQKGLSLITTEKDYFRLLGNPELISIITSRASYYLKIETDIFEGKEILQQMLRQAVGVK
ncbi:MAG: tetraacyldisaccharide 4'-kinase [Chlorobiaceae bacterium]|nr:tetraacyldisaccharide 4'-kinase [Chlorobiaceae bacterium]